MSLYVLDPKEGFPLHIFCVWGVVTSGSMMGDADPRLLLLKYPHTMTMSNYSLVGSLYQSHTSTHITHVHYLF